MKTTLSAILLLALLMACNVAFPQQTNQVRQVPLSQILAGSIAPTLKDVDDPFVRIPAHYVSLKWGNGAIVGSPTSVESFKTSGAVTEGLFLITLNMDRSFSPSNKRLSDEAPDFVSMMKKSGFKNVQVQRKDVGRISALGITFEQRDGPGYMAFIAIGNDGPVWRIDYVVPAAGSEADARRWKEFMEGLGHTNAR